MQNKRVKFAIFTIIYWALRIPLLSKGFGLDSDSWRIVRAGQYILSTGKYQMSRFPGYPFTEYITAFLVKFHSVFLINFVFALFGFGLCLILWNIIDKHFAIDKKIGFWIIMALSVFTPFYSATVESIDYIPSLFFAFLALWVFLEKKELYWLSAIIVGISTGFRFTSAIFTLIWTILVWRKIGIKKASIYLIIGAAITLGTYSFVILQILIRAKNMVEKSLWEYSHMPYYLYKFFGVWFIIAFLIVICSKLKKIWNFLKQNMEFSIAAILFSVLFIIFPYDPGYLLPILIILALLLAKIPNKYSLFLLGALILNDFVIVEPKYIELPYEYIKFKPHIETGEFIQYVEKRIDNEKIFQQILSWSKKQKRPTIVLLSSVVAQHLIVEDERLEQVKHYTKRVKGTNVILSGDKFNRKKIAEFLKKYKLVAIEGICRDTYISYGYNLMREFSDKIDYVPMSKIKEYFK